MVTYFPRYFSVRAIICYVATLALVSAFFISYALPFQFMLFGFVPVVLFFNYSNKLTMDWRKYKPATFAKKLFLAALIIRVIYVVFIYFYYIEKTGQPHMYHPGDELLYHQVGSFWRVEGYSTFISMMDEYVGFSDSGYCWWLAIEYLLLGNHVLPARIVKCVIDAFSCVLIYNFAKRNFGEYTGRIAAIFCMLMPNMWYYCGLTLKETEMTFMTILFAERTDMALRSRKIMIRNLVLPGIIILAMFAFRTALAAVLVLAMAVALVLTSGKQLEMWKKIVYVVAFALWMLLTIGVEMIQETELLWEGRTSNQTEGYEWRSNRVGGNTFAQYATASVFAPFIFTIPFSSMVEIPNQENQMLMNGANFIKNVMSGFVIFALFSLLFSGEWRKHVLPLAVMGGYLAVLVFSNFAHSERFHFPVLGLELMFAAYGISLVKNRQKRWYGLWLIFVCLVNVAWAWVKLAGRGMAS